MKRRSGAGCSIAGEYRSERVAPMQQLAARALSPRPARGTVRPEPSNDFSVTGSGSTSLLATGRRSRGELRGARLWRTLGHAVSHGDASMPRTGVRAATLRRLSRCLAPDPCYFWCAPALHSPSGSPKVRSATRATSFAPSTLRPSTAPASRLASNDRAEPAAARHLPGNARALRATMSCPAC